MSFSKFSSKFQGSIILFGSKKPVEIAYKLIILYFLKEEERGRNLARIAFHDLYPDEGEGRKRGMDN